MHLNHGPQIFSRKTDGPHMLSMHHEIVSGFDNPVALPSSKHVTCVLPSTLGIQF